MTLHRPQVSPRSGSALVATLLVIVVLTIIVVAFLQSMTIERQTAHSYLNRYQAQLAADAAVDYAKNLIHTTISDDANKQLDSGKALVDRLYNGKVNFITWAYSPSADTFAPYYTGILSNAIPRKPNPGGDQAVDSVDRTVWLVSDPANSTPPASPNTVANASDPNRFPSLPISQQFNMNFKLPAPPGGTPTYWIDPSGTPYPVGWVDLPVVVPTGTASVPPLKVRYAFWVDDEMGRADLSVLGHTAQDVRKGNTYKASPEDLVIHTGQDSTDSTAFSGENMGTIANSDNRKIERLSPLSMRQVIDQSGRDFLDKNSLAYTTRNTDALKQPANDVLSVYDLIPYGPLAGQPKINLNEAFTKANAAAPDQPAKFVWDLTDTAENPDSSYSDFTKRPNVPSIQTALPEYYARKNSPPGNVLRIAASIRDYLSPETYPTIAPGLSDYLVPILNKAYSLWKSDYQGDVPSFATIDWGSIPLTQRWYGNKGGPFVNAIQMSNTFSATSCNFNTTFYLWNPSDRTITLTDAYMLVFNYPWRNAPSTHNGTQVDGLPYFRGDVFPIGAATLAPRAQKAVSLSRTYSGGSGSGSPTGTKLGFVLFTRDSSGVTRILDGYRVSSSKTYSASTGIPGGGQTGAGNEWDTKDRRQNLALHQTEWSTASGTPVGGNLAGFQDLKRWYDQPPGTSSSSTEPIMHIALGPIRSLGELGNIFDPINDIGVSKNDTFARTLPSGGNTQSRGGKTLVVGQFDDFFDKLQTAAPANPMIAANGWSSYEKYLRFADTALFDLFTVKTTPLKAAADPITPNSQDGRPFNINTSRPNSSGDLATTNLSPLSTYLGAINSALGAGALGTGLDGLPSSKKLSPTTKFLAAARERLTHGGDWKQCRPFRNYSDLMLLGLTKISLNNIQANKNQSLFYAGATTYYLTSPTKIGVTLNNIANSTSVLSARNNQRQAPFARLAEQTTFRSYQYRIYAVGQVYREGQENKPLSTVYQTYTYDLNPIYDATIPVPSDPSTQPDNIVLHPKLQRVEEN